MTTSLASYNTTTLNIKATAGQQTEPAYYHLT